MFPMVVNLPDLLLNSMVPFLAAPGKASTAAPEPLPLLGITRPQWGDPVRQWLLMFLGSSKFLHFTS